MERHRIGNVQTGAMSESAYSLHTLERIRRERLGNYTVLFIGPWSNPELEKVAAFCAENGCRFVMDETICRISGEVKKSYQEFDFKHLARLAEKYRNNFDGSLLMCEYGGLTLYWPESTVAGSPMRISATADAAEAESDMVRKLRRVIAKSRRLGLPRPYISIEASGLVAEQLYKAGIDRVDYEMTYDPDNELFYSAVKGVARCCGNGNFGVDMAMVWYGGNQHDRLWFKRWYLSLLHAFIRGADPIYAEHGLMDYRALGKNLDAEHPHVAGFRRELKKLSRLAAAHPRAALPEATLAVIKGNLDSYSGLGQLYRWGQRGKEEMRRGDAEKSWELFDTLYRRNSWEFRDKTGKHDCSGNPPDGQLDVIPASARETDLRRYKGLFFLGSHVMTDEIYRCLCRYVGNGGKLLLCTAHLNCDTRIGEFKLYNHGDVSELCGVKLDAADVSELPQGIKFATNPPGGRSRFPLWSADCDPKYADGPFRMAGISLTTATRLAVASDSFADGEFHDRMLPVITVNQLGKGQVILVNSLDFPGHPALQRLYRDLLRTWSAGFSRRPEIECSDRVRYAVYREKNLRVIYLLNTEENLHSDVLFERKIQLRLPPTGLLAVYRRGDVTAIPDSPLDRLCAITFGENREITCHLLKKPVGNVTTYRNGKVVPCTISIG